MDMEFIEVIDMTRSRPIRRIILAAVAVSLLPWFCGPGFAQERWEHEHHGGWHRDGDIRRFHEHDEGRWRGGRWHHGRHAGRLGWWWIVGGVWYFYPQPVYPYPDPYQPPVIAVPPQPAPPAYWYYCPNPPGYYPYIPSCPVPWQRIVPTAPMPPR